MLAAILLLAVLTNSLTLSQFAQVSVGLLSGQLIAIFVDAGVNNELLRFAGTDEAESFEERLVGSSIVRLLVMVPVAGLIFIGASLFYGVTGGQVVALTALSAMLATLADSFLISLRALRRFRVELIQSFVQLALIGGLALVVFLPPSLVGGLLVALRVIGVLALFGTLATMSGLDVVRRMIGPKAIWEHYQRLRHYLLESVFSNVNVRLDSVFILALLGQQVFALYQPAARLYYSSLSLAGVVGGLAIPPAARETKWPAIRRLVGAFSTAGAVLSLLLFAVLLYGVGPVFGANFSPSTYVCIMLAVTLFLRFLGAGLGSYLTLRGQQKTRANVGAAILCFSSLAMVAVWAFGVPSLPLILVVLAIGQFLNIVLFSIVISRI